MFTAGLKQMSFGISERFEYDRIYDIVQDFCGMWATKQNGKGR